MRLAIYDPETGSIQSVMQFSDARVEDALLNIPEGMLALEVAEDVTPATHYIGADDQPTEYPERPADRAVWDGSKWTDPRDESELLAQVRVRRNGLLASSDWTQLPDAPLTEDQRGAWADYRQALRDLPETASDLAAPIWPPQPT